MPKATMALVLSLAGLVATAPAQQTAPVQQTAPASTPDSETQLAARSLRDSALALIHQPDSPARAGRLVALARFADKLADDPETDWLLAFVARSQGDPVAEAAAARSILEARPNDYATAVLWLSLATSAASSVEEKTALLESVAANEDLSAAVRSLAITKKAKLLVRQGERGMAESALAQALTLDPLNVEALRIRTGLSGTGAKAEQTQLMLTELMANPFSEQPAWQLAGWLNELGLHAESLDYFEYAWQMARRRSAPQEQVFALSVDYVNAILDAEQYEMALGRLSSLLSTFGDSHELAWMLIEALRGAGESEQAEKYIAQVESAQLELVASDDSMAEQVQQAALFYLLMKDDPAAALEILGPDPGGRAVDDLVVQRIIGAAELASVDPDLTAAGLARLGRIMDRDIYAAAFLARHHFTNNNEAAGREAIRAGIAIARSGPAYRMLRETARAQGVIIEAAGGSAEVAGAIGTFDSEYLAAGLSPEKFLSVTIQPIASEVGYCESIEVEVVLENIGTIRLPIIQPEDGGLEPQVSLLARIEDRRSDTFSDLPTVTLPVPRYLEPGQIVSARTRIDIGKLGDYLDGMAFDDLSLIVGGVFSPIQVGEDVVSAVPTLPVGATRIARKSLFAVFSLSAGRDVAGTYQKSLGYIVRDIKRGDLRRRLRAARQVGTLLSLTERSGRKWSSVPLSVSAMLDRLVLVRMLQEVLADSTALVRAEMLAALEDVTLDEIILRELASVASDPSPLVRFRLAELIGVSGTPGHETIVSYLVQDPDEMVQLMAKAVQGANEASR